MCAIRKQQFALPLWLALRRCKRTKCVALLFATINACFLFVCSFVRLFSASQQLWPSGCEASRRIAMDRRKHCRRISNDVWARCRRTRASKRTNWQFGMIVVVKNIPRPLSKYMMLFCSFNDVRFISWCNSRTIHLNACNTLLRWLVVSARTQRRSLNQCCSKNDSWALNKILFVVMLFF